MKVLILMSALAPLAVIDMSSQLAVIPALPVLYKDVVSEPFVCNGSYVSLFDVQSHYGNAREKSFTSRPTFLNESPFTCSTVETAGTCKSICI